MLCSSKEHVVFISWNTNTFMHQAVITIVGPMWILTGLHWGGGDTTEIAKKRYVSSFINLYFMQCKLRSRDIKQFPNITCENSKVVYRTAVLYYL